MTGQKTTPMFPKNMGQKITHAINTPLSGVIGCLEILNSFGNTFDFDDLTDLRSSSLHAAKDLQKVLDNLMQYHYVIDHCPNDSTPNCPDSFSSSEQIAKLIRHKAVERQRVDDLDLNIAPFIGLGIPHFYLQKIINEVIDNACIYSDKGTKITIRGEAKDTQFQLSIRDSGEGMSAEQISSIGPFIQFNQHKKGLGLGLFIARNFLLKFQGGLSIKSEVGKGTEIILSFPIG